VSDAPAYRGGPGQGDMDYRQAREALTEAGWRSANEAQGILADLAHWGPNVAAFSYRRADGVVHWLRYTGLDVAGAPVFNSSTRHPVSDRRAAPSAEEAAGHADGHQAGDPGNGLPG
jgi:hypothetical protein